MTEGKGKAAMRRVERRGEEGNGKGKE